ncbi:MAG: sulfotransferase family 2 domain-containing protein [Luteimonas sp.]|nr:sulfotransferase family 2 domain-containing protein [Luteimonas sp.]
MHSTQSILVSLHLPKTAGTSFASALQAQHGPGYLADYDDLPMQVAPWLRKFRALRAGLDLRRSWPDGVTCVHGHFLPAKYLYALRGRSVRYVTWLRDPVERVVSHYEFWRRDYDGSDPKQPLRNRMLAEDWSLQRFALGPEMRDLYTQYLWRFDPRRFAFIGVTERYDDDLGRFADLFGTSAAVRGHALRNPDRGDARYPISAGLRTSLIQHHARDMALYHWATTSQPRTVDREGAGNP